MRRVTKKTTTTSKSKQGRRKAIPLWRRKSVRLGAVLACILGVSGTIGWSIESGLMAKAYNNSVKKVVSFSAKYGFTVQEIFVSGRDLTSKNQLLKALKVKRGTPIFSITLAEAQKRVEKLPWVASAVVERRLPDTVMLHVSERRPMARWQRKGKFYLLDDTGTVIAEKDITRFKSLPLVVGNDAPKHAAEILTVLASQPQLAVQVKAAVRVSARRWNIVMNNDVSVRLPEEKMSDAWNNFAEYQERHNLLSRDLRTIDLRQPDRMIVRRKNGKPKTIPTDSPADPNGSGNKKTRGA